MGKSWSRALGFGLLAVVAVAAAGCGQIGMLKAKMAFKDANALYQGQDYRAAAAKYEEVLENDPSLTYAYFFLGNSYDQQYRSVKRGEAGQRRPADQGDRQLQEVGRSGNAIRKSSGSRSTTS